MTNASQAIEQSEYERLLDQTREQLIKLKIEALRNGLEFEQAVFEAMKGLALGTPFDGKIQRTRDGAFPDIIVGQYGLEVKLTSKAKFTTTGNSIFESSRDQNAEFLYLLICKTGGRGKEIKWCKYEDAISDVVVSHSPRYKIDLEGKSSIFEKMGISYYDFSLLPNEEKMDFVRKIYEDSQSYNWWLTLQERDVSYRMFRDLNKPEQNDLKAKTLLLFPVMFDHTDIHKFNDPHAYWLSLGIICHNFRDEFTAGGTVEINHSTYPHIFGVAMNLSKRIRHLATRIPELKDSWRQIGVAIDDPTSTKAVITQWKGLVKYYFQQELPEGFFDED